MIGAWNINHNPIKPNIVEISEYTSNNYGLGFATVWDAEKYPEEISLIFAAPELLEVCETLAKRAPEWIDEVTHGQGLYEQLMDAINKAKGVKH